MFPCNRIFPARPIDIYIWFYILICMKLINLKKYEIFDGVHMYGSEVNVFYLSGVGFITSSGELSSDSDEVAEIEEFLQNPIDPRIEHRKRNLEENVRDAVRNGQDETEVRNMLENMEPIFDPMKDCYLKIVGDVELSEQEVQEFLEADRSYLVARENREAKLKFLISKIS